MCFSKCKPFKPPKSGQEVGRGKYVSYKDVLIFAVRDDNVKCHCVHRERKSLIEHQLHLFRKCQMAVALDLLYLTLQFRVWVLT